MATDAICENLWRSRFTSPKRQIVEIPGSTSDVHTGLVGLADIPVGSSLPLPPEGRWVAYGIYAARDISRFTVVPGRDARGYARDKSQMDAEEQAVELIIEDVIRQARLAGKADRAERLRAGGWPQGDDFDLYAAHVKGALRVVPLRGASSLEPRVPEARAGDGGAARGVPR